MSKFRTALDALRECYMHWTDETSIEESNAREMLLSLCQLIADRQGLFVARKSEDKNATTT